MDLRYALSEIRKNGSNVHWWRQRLLTNVVSKYFKTYREADSPPIHECDWDTLIILDACRYDLFEECYPEFDLSGTLSKRTSLESGTPGFLRENFGDEDFHDVVYVTGNAYVSTLLSSNQFHDVIPAWKDNWDDDVQTVTPEAMGEVAKRVAEEYPDKRLIFHFVQPHEPFIGEKRVGIREQSAIRQQALGKEAPAHAKRKPTAFEQLDRGKLTKQAVWDAYRSNLERALPVVSDLLTEIDGKTVVTADHGNSFGEFAKPFPIRVYGHPLGIYIPSLTEVPYFEYQNGERRDITAERPKSRVSEDMEVANERLRMLGYAE
ncbi:hypothetical protein [Haloferax sp. DFSO60]|uniref:hypothetical protein n=1 Tax=Haloferax sp. DFSO60 TaxID=3388652 RepID=UPI00397DA95E